MLIVKENMLSLISEKFYFDEQLYSGVALKIEDGVVIKKKVYKNGVLQDLEFSLPFTRFKSSFIDVDFDCLNGYEEPYFYDGCEFSGCAYKFSDGVCNIIHQYELGFSVSDVEYKNGKLIKLEFAEEDEKFSQAFNWEHDGSYSFYGVTDQGVFNFSLAFIDNCVTALTVDGKYFEELNRVRSKIKYLDFNMPDFTKNLTAANYLYISGTGVDDTMFDGLLESGLKKTLQLRICRTSITSKSINKLLKCRSIVDLSIETESITLENMKEFKSRKPACHVEYNREEVLA